MYIYFRWLVEMNELGKVYTWVQIFENKGSIMGCSNPHPHCQIWASDFLPNEATTKNIQLKKYYDKYNKPLLMDYVEKELKHKVRLLNELFSFRYRRTCFRYESCATTNIG